MFFTFHLIHIKMSIMFFISQFKFNVFQLKKCIGFLDKFEIKYDLNPVLHAHIKRMIRIDWMHVVCVRSSLPCDF